jgi:hypothetical protein
VIANAINIAILRASLIFTNLVRDGNDIVLVAELARGTGGWRPRAATACRWPLTGSP